MSEMAVIVPTRGRPQNIRRLIEAWATTRAQAVIWLGVDDDDDTFDLAALNGFIQEFEVDVQVTSLPRTTMNGTLNAIAHRAALDFPYVGFMGDDHLVRTENWDQQIISSLGSNGPSIVYGNDLMQGPLLPTAVFMTSNIIRCLGYMSPPALHHLHLDTAWLEWGKRLEIIQYLPDVVIEHMHPQAGKAEWDEGHVRVNAGAMWQHDSEVYADYVERFLEQDIENLRSI